MIIPLNKVDENTGFAAGECGAVESLDAKALGAIAQEIAQEVLEELTQTDEGKRCLEDMYGAHRTIDTIEEGSVRLRRLIMNTVLQHAFSKEKGYMIDPHCDDCGSKARYMRVDSKTVVLLTGVAEAERIKYQCLSCGKTWC